MVSYHCSSMHVGKMTNHNVDHRQFAGVAPEVDLGKYVYHIPLPSVIKAAYPGLRPREVTTKNSKEGYKL